MTVSGQTSQGGARGAGLQTRGGDGMGMGAGAVGAPSLRGTESGQPHGPQILVSLRETRLAPRASELGVRCPPAHDQTQWAAGGTLPCGRSDPRGVRGAAAQRVWTEGRGPEPGGGEVRGTTQGEQCGGVNVGGAAWAPPRARPQPQPASSCSRDTSGGQASGTAPPPTLAGSRGRPPPGPGRQGPAWEEGGTPRAEHPGRERSPTPPGAGAEAPVERPAGIGSTAPQRGQSSQGRRSPGGDAAHRLADTAGQRIPRCPGRREARVAMPQKLRD